MTSDNQADSILIDQQVDRICDHLEVAWLAGQTISIEEWMQANFLVVVSMLPAQSPEVERTFRQRLISELVALEVSFRRMRGERLTVAEYLRRFPSVERTAIEAWIENSGPKSEATLTESLRPLQDVECKLIGSYYIIEKIGQGGMGEVYRAQQRSPIRREVAIKLIKLGMDTKSVIARFEAERQALALMDHPHISKVYEASTDQNGRPYFVMEYVRGKPITEYADMQQLTVLERLKLFQQVCRAIQHAHEKGIIHRDIKPSNILAFTQDGVPHVKVIDFGIAKAVSQPLTDKTLFTLHNQFIGTPQYMSPEQAEGNLDVDTRSDVYSLGVLLYELLTGSTPFSLNQLKAVALERFRQIICEVEPPKPSTRLNSSQESLPTLAAQRRTDPLKLGNLVRGELDWIVMLSLEKDRRQRYESPGKMAEDVSNFLEGRPVIAAPPSRLYRLKKTVRKHRWSLGVVSAFIGMLIIGSVISWVQTARILQSLKDLKVQKDRAEINEKKAADSLTESQQNLYHASVALAHRECLANSAESALKILDESPREMRGWEWGYIRRLCHAYLRQWRLADLNLQFATSLAVDRRQPLIAVGSYSGVAVINIDNGNLLYRWKTKEPARDVQFSPDGKSLVIGTGQWLEDPERVDPGRLLVYDLSSGLLTHEHETNFVSALDLGRGSRLIYATQKQLFSRRDQEVRELANAEEAEPWAIESLRFNPKRTRFAVAQRESVAKIFDAVSGSLISELRGHTQIVWDCAFSPDERYLATASDDGTVKIWDALSGRDLLTFRGHLSTVEAVAFSPDSKLVASGGRDQRICIWDPETGQITRTLNGHSSAIVGIAFAADGRLVSCDFEGKVLTWDPTVDQEALALNHLGAGYVAYMPGGEELVTFGTDENVVFWQALTGARLREMQVGWTGMCGLALNSDAKCAVIGEHIQIWDAKTSQKLFEIPCSSKPYRGRLSLLASNAKFHPDGDTLAIAFHDGVRTYSLAKRSELRTLSDGRVLDFSPDGTLLAAATRNGLILWETATGEKINALPGHKGGIRCVTFHPNGRWIATGGRDKKVWIWDIKTGQTLSVLDGHGGSVNSLVFSPDGKRLASAGDDMTIRLWETDRWRRVLTLSGHTDRIDRLAFSPDGTTLLSASFDGTIRMWESAPKNEEVEKLREQVRRAKHSNKSAAPQTFLDWLLSPNTN